MGPPTLITVAETLVRNAALFEPGADSSSGNPWLNRLLRTRTIVLLPISNAVGYENIQRTELGVDPNRDFPYNTPAGACMHTAVARALNEVWMEHMFQLAVTFHGGMQAIAYEWGSYNHEVPGVAVAACAACVFLCRCLLI